MVAWKRICPAIALSLALVQGVARADLTETGALSGPLSPSTEEILDLIAAEPLAVQNAFVELVASSSQPTIDGAVYEAAVIVLTSTTAGVDPTGPNGPAGTS